MSDELGEEYTEDDMSRIRSAVGRGGANRPSDVIIVQQLLNANLGRLTPLRALPENGVADDTTIGAIEEFQRRVVLMNRPDGRVDPDGRTIRLLARGVATRGAGTGAAPWIAIARREVGIKESAGRWQNHPRILEYIGTFPYLRNIRTGDRALLAQDPATRLSDVDETPWCACFVNWCLIQAGRPPGPAARARSWLTYGTRLDQPRIGAVTVVYHRPSASTAGTTASGYHVAFWTGGDGSRITLLGGNQSNRVSERTYVGYWTVQGYRWPPG